MLTLNENRIRLLIIFLVAAIHVVLIFFLSFTLKVASQVQSENARVMKLTDFSELRPEPPPPPPREIQMPNQVESIAETMIETEVVPEQIIVAPGTITAPVDTALAWEDEYLPQYKVTTLPVFNEKELLADLVYPIIAQRAGITGNAILELFVDRNGLVQQVLILQENPAGRGFGEAAVKAFTGRRGTPAYANGEPVSVRYRYPVRFTIK